MDPRLLHYYNRELKFMREMGGEFAREYPKIAGRLGLDEFECADPYVERLLEGFALMAARVQLKVDAEFPRFTQHLLELTYPHFLSPLPAMGIVQFKPDLAEGALGDGFPVPRHSMLRSSLGNDDVTGCQFRTAHEVTLWPLAISDADYFSSAGAVATLGVPEGTGARAGIRLRFKVTAGLKAEDLGLDELMLYLRGADEFPMLVYEQMIGNCVGAVVRPVAKPPPWQELLDAGQVSRGGFSDDEALLPYGRRSFQGYRLLHEYFAFPQRYLFVRLTGLQKAIKRCMTDEFEVIVLLGSADKRLDRVLDASHFSLFCTPAINLFPRRADRIHLRREQAEYHLVVDRTRPMDFEVHTVTSVKGHGSGGESSRTFRPFYASTDRIDHAVDNAYFTIQRRPRVMSTRQKEQGPRSGYLGSEVFLSLVDGRQAPLDPDLKQLAVTTLCTNRDLPLQMSVGQGTSDFTLETGAPVEAINCIDGPSRPRLPVAEGEAAWKLVSHLALNYLSLVDAEDGQGAAALREFLTLYGNAGDSQVRKQIEGVRSVASRPTTGRLPVAGPISFGRGLHINLTFDEAAFEGSGVFVLGAVLEQFFRRYVSLNSFTQTSVSTFERGEIMRWPARIGRRQTL